MTTMKKLASLVLAMLMLLSLTACGGDGGGSTKSDLPEELQQYLSPWEKDAVAEAKEKGTMEFYFMATLGLAKVPYEKWVKWFLPLLIIEWVLAIIFMVVAQLIQWGPF